ncbi:MAG TPA: M23 family metallopeptidase, partial [Dehalococcoidia bacterium]|nr:M23 family metallopeptidase [Dehalococcoidia bacterium]
MFTLRGLISALVALLTIALAGAAAACGGEASGADRVSVSTATATPGEPPPKLTLTATAVRQGGVLGMQVEGAGIAVDTIQFGDRLLRLAPTPEGAWAAIGVAVDEPPGEYALEVSVVGPDARTHVLHAVVQVTPYDFPIDAVDLAPDVASLLDPSRVAEEERILQRTLRGFSDAPAPPVRFQRPLAGEITTTFGQARVYNGQEPAAADHHRGMDIGADEGTEVAAAAAGTVVLARELPIRGTYVMIDHGLGVFTGYGHLAEMRVREGDPVTAGQVIGLV